MLNRLTFVIGFSAGYVLGTRAGRERYEQIQRMFRGLAENPGVQSTAGLLQAQAVGLVGSARRVARDKVAETVGGRDVTAEVTTPYPH